MAERYFLEDERLSARLHDKKGVPIYAGDLLRSPHFKGSERQAPLPLPCRSAVPLRLNLGDEQMFYVAACLVPFIGALQRYAVAYGYEGKSKATARDEAWRVWVILVIACCLFVVARQFEAV